MVIHTNHCSNIQKYNQLHQKYQKPGTHNAHFITQNLWEPILSGSESGQQEAPESKVFHGLPGYYQVVQRKG